MADSGRVVFREEVLLLELGVRLHQLQLLYPYAIQSNGNPLDYFDRNIYGGRIRRLWDLISETNAIKDAAKETLRKEWNELDKSWQDAVANDFRGEWALQKYRVYPQLTRIAQLIDEALPTSPLASWYRVGYIATVGRQDPITHVWHPAGDASFQTHLDATGLSVEELIQIPVKSHIERDYPVEFYGWRQLDAGLVRLTARAVAATPPGSNVSATTAAVPLPLRPKRSTQRGEAEAKLISVLTEQHKYANGVCEEFTPIGVNEAARKAGVSNSTASEFFKKKFHSFSNYKVACHDRKKLNHSLELLNGEVMPNRLFVPLTIEPRDSKPDE